MPSVLIGKHLIGDDNPVFVIAEAGSNHDGDVQVGHQLIDMAADCGADGVKFQKFDTDRLVSKEGANAQYIKTAMGKDETLYQLLDRLELSKERFREFQQHAKERGLEFWASIFDFESVDVMVELGVETIKVGAGDTDNFPLNRHVARTGLVIQLSTGMSTLEQVKECLRVFKEEGNNKVILFQCTSSYPCPVESLNLLVIDAFRTLFPGVVVGFSDHSQSVLTPSIAVCLGAKIHERHITIDTSRYGADHSMSTGPEDYAELIKNIRATEAVMKKRKLAHTIKAEEIISVLEEALLPRASAKYLYARDWIAKEVKTALGSPEKRQLPVEQNIIDTMRKSVHTRKPVQAGEAFSWANLDILRPQEGGILPEKFELVLGKRAKTNIPANKQLKPELIEGWDAI